MQRGTQLHSADLVPILFSPLLISISQHFLSLPCPCSSLYLFPIFPFLYDNSFLALSLSLSLFPPSPFLYHSNSFPRLVPVPPYLSSPSSHSNMITLFFFIALSLSLSLFPFQYDSSFFPHQSPKISRYALQPNSLTVTLYACSRPPSFHFYITALSSLTYASNFPDIP